jgi:hypothetical protein
LFEVDHRTQPNVAGRDVARPLLAPQRAVIRSPHLTREPDRNGMAQRSSCAIDEDVMNAAVTRIAEAYLVGRSGITT